MYKSPLELAIHYWIDDVPSAATVGSRLNNLLASLTKGQPMTATSRVFLSSRGLDTLVRFLDGRLSEEQFNHRAQAERGQRIALAQRQQMELEAQTIAEQNAADAREAAMWNRLEAERIQRENDPKFIAWKKNQELLRRYGVNGFVEGHHVKQLMSILCRLESKLRLKEQDTEWLKTEGRDYKTNQVLHAYHRIEANFYVAEYKRTNDPWQAVNASAHLRKCAAPEDAIELLASIPDGRKDQPKLTSAKCTTHGGALRDLGHYTEALEMAERAHALQPNDFRPCTLLGALNIGLGNFELGCQWYRLAEECGAKSDSIKHDIRSMFVRMTAEQRTEAVAELLRIDPVKFRWLRKESTRGD